MCRVNSLCGWGSLFAFALVALIAERAIAADSLRITLSPGQSTGSLVFELGNVGSEPVTVLTTDTPLEPLLGDDVFDIRRPAKQGPMFIRPTWIGPHVRRLPPSEGDFLVLQPGEAVMADVDLYALYAVTEAADYTISYRGELTVASLPPDAAAIRLKSGATLDTVTAEGNTLYMPLARSPPRARARPAAYTACSSSQVSLLDEATDAAERITGEALDSLVATPETARAAARRYSEWFGPYTASRYQAVSDGYSRIFDSLQSATLSYDCSCDRQNVYAYVFPVALHEIYLCPVFWQTDTLGTDSRAGTLIHELSHFTALVGTDDHAYGQRAARALAQTDPDTAIDNADNIGYFAENDPVLPMSGGAAPTDTVPAPPQLPAPTTAQALSLDVPVSRRIARNEIQAYDVRGAGQVTVTPISGDPDLYVYDDPGRGSNSLVCSSRRATQVDSCVLDVGSTHYVSVLGYDDASYEIVASSVDLPSTPDVGVTDAIVLAEGGSYRSVVAAFDSVVFTVDAPTTMLLTSFSGDANLDVYAGASLTTSERICQSNLTTQLDTCEITESGTVYAVVIGYSDASFSLEARPSGRAPVGPPDDDPIVMSGDDDDDDDDGIFGGGLDWPGDFLILLAVGCRRRGGSAS